MQSSSIKQNYPLKQLSFRIWRERTNKKDGITSRYELGTAEHLDSNKNSVCKVETNSCIGWADIVRTNSNRDLGSWRSSLQN